MLTRGRIFIWLIKHIVPWTVAMCFGILMGVNIPIVFQFGEGIPLIISVVALGIGLSFAQDSIIEDIRQKKVKPEQEQDQEVRNSKKGKMKVTSKDKRNHEEVSLHVERDPEQLLLEVKLLDEINKMIIVFEKDLLKGLPPESWNAKVSLDRGLISIDVTRDDNLLVQQGWGQAADPTWWLFAWIPKISHFIKSRKHLVHEATKIKFSVISNEDTWLTTNRAKDLIDAAEAGLVNEFGSMMTYLDPEIIKH